MSIPKGDESSMAAAQLGIGSTLSMTTKAALELGLFEIIAKAGGAHLTAPEIASQLPTENPDAPAMIERMLNFLASSSVLTSSEGNGNSKRRGYGLSALSKHLVPNEDGVSLAPLLLFLHDKVVIDSWHYMKDAVLEGGIPFNKAHGMNAFEYPQHDSRYNDVFNLAMYNETARTLKTILKTYKGFECINEIVDVGGGFAATLSAIVSKYPHIKSINFDLPHVVKDAPAISGVEHVGGDMFEEVPKGETIFMKYILHDWSDDHCLKLLKNCWKALPDSGKIIVMDSLLPESLDQADPISINVFALDVCMMTLNPGGKERTKKQFDDLAKKTGFTVEVICQVPDDKLWILEFHKQH